MADCTKCKYAEWTYETYYNTREKQWFVEGCKKVWDVNEDNCEEFEEVEDDRYDFNI